MLRIQRGMSVCVSTLFASVSSLNLAVNSQRYVPQLLTACLIMLVCRFAEMMATTIENIGSLSAAKRNGLRPRLKSKAGV